MILYGIFQFLLYLASLFLTLIALRHLFYTAIALISPYGTRPVESPATNFIALIPAHNEESHVPQTILSMKAQDYPERLFRIVVLADNCTDKTAEVARALGAQVVERNDPDNPGKGRALRWFAASKKWHDDEALVCVDADSVATPNYLKSLDAAIQHGARAVQGYNGAKDPKGSSLAALSVITNTMKNAGTYSGRASMHLPVPLMNGWCVTGGVLRDHGWESFSLTEDFEETLRLGMKGIYPRFVPQAAVLSEKARDFSEALSQRKRWSGGESALTRSLAWPALKMAVRTRALGLFELSMDVLLPGYATMSAGLTACLILALVFGVPSAFAASLVGLIVVLLLAVLGFFQAGPSRDLATGLLLAPFYILWKTAIAAWSRIRPPKGWNG